MTSVSVGSSGFGRMPFVMQQKYLAVSFQGSLSSLQWEVFRKVGLRTFSRKLGDKKPSRN